MRHHCFLPVLASLITSAAFGQPMQERTFRFTHVTDVREIQELATLVRAISELPKISTNTEQPGMMAGGSAQQMALAEWLVNEMDSAPNQSPVTREYRMPGVADDIVRVFYLSELKTVQQLQEAATLIRAITETRRLFTYNASKAVVIRGTAEQIKATEWMLPEFTRGGPDTEGREHRMSGDPEGVVRVFHLKPTLSVQELQEVATLVRAISEIRRLFTYNATQTIVMRGTQEQMQLAQWLISELDKPSDAPGDFRMTNGDVVHVFYVPGAATVKRLQEIAVEVRRTTGVRRLFTYNTPRAITIRGSSDQIATAARLIKERNQ